MLVKTFSFLFSANSAIVVVGGIYDDVYLHDVEIIDVGEKNLKCTMPDFPRKFYAASAAIIEEQMVICGGYSNGFQSSCHLFNQTTLQWQKITSLTTSRGWFGMAKLNGGLIAVGGYHGSDYLKTTEILTTASSTWSRSSELPVTIEQHCVVRLNNDTVMAIGGYRNGKVSYFILIE